MSRTSGDRCLRILVRANCSAAFHFGDGLKTNEGRWCVGRSWNGRSSTYFVTASSLLRSYVTSFSALWHTRRDRLVEAGVGLSCAREAKLPQMKRRRGDLLVHWYCTGVEQGHWMGLPQRFEFFEIGSTTPQVLSARLFTRLHDFWHRGASSHHTCFPVRLEALRNTTHGRTSCHPRLPFLFGSSGNRVGKGEHGYENKTPAGHLQSNSSASVAFNGKACGPLRSR